MSIKPVLSQSKHFEHGHPEWGVEQVGWIGQSGQVYALEDPPYDGRERGSFSPLYQPRDEECGHPTVEAARTQAALTIAYALIPFTRSSALVGEGPFVHRSDVSRALGAALRTIDVGVPAWRQWKHAEHDAALDARTHDTDHAEPEASDTTEVGL